MEKRLARTINASDAQITADANGTVYLVVETIEIPPFGLVLSPHTISMLRQNLDVAEAMLATRTGNA